MCGVFGGRESKIEQGINEERKVGDDYEGREKLEEKREKMKQEERQTERKRQTDG